jgi:rhodanese-related sulfurtransferase
MSTTELPLEIPASRLAQMLRENAAIVLLDCREPYENATARIEPSELIPMNTIPANLGRIESLAEDKQLVVYCHHGVRSLNTVAWLRRQGIENAVSLSGGIDRWSMEIDPQVPRY